MKYSKEISNLLSVHLFDGKLIEEVEEIISEIKTKFLEYGIDQLEFISTRFLIKAFCEIRGVNYDQIFVRSGLEKQLTPTEKQLTEVVKEKISYKFDKEIVHKKILSDLPNVLKTISTNQEKYSLTFEIKKIKQEYIIYTISKNKVPCYSIRGAQMYDNKIMFAHFLPNNLPFETEIPESVGQILKVQAKKLGGKPYLSNILLDEVGKLIKILETL